MNKLLLVIAFGMVVTACAVYTLVEPRRTNIGEAYTVEPQIAWSATKAGNAVIWTVDGPFLQELRFISAVSDNEPLVEDQPGRKSPTFRRGMTAIEIKELVADSFGAVGAQKIETKSLKPFSFGGHRGFRFELTYLAGNGLEKEALIVGGIIEGKLYLIAYTGARAHYFPKHKDQVERLIASIKMQ